MTTERRRGWLTAEEKKIIKAEAKLGKSAVQISAEGKVNRNPETIQKYIDVHVLPPSAKPLPTKEEEVQKLVIRKDLKTSQAWKNLKEEFTPGELEYFEESYTKLMTQLAASSAGGVLASEETQIFQAVKFEILMSRNMVGRRRALEDVQRLEKMQGDILRPVRGDASKLTDAQKEFLVQLETQLNIARTAEQNRTNEYVKLQERHDALMKSLKAQRDQRVKDFEKAGTDFLSVIKMLNRKDVQDREGRQLELMKMAGLNAHRKLGEPTEYEDGSVDSPILSVDTVGEAPPETEEEGEEE